MSDLHSTNPWTALMVGVLLCLIATPAAAQRRERPEELIVGPFLLAPSVDFEVDADTNVRREDLEGEDASDTSTSLTLGLDAMLPFRQSKFELGLAADSIEYDKNSFASDVATDFSAAFELVFSGGQRLLVSEQFQHDFTQVRDTSVPELDPENPPEELYFGEPFNHNRIRMQFDKLGPAGRGYVMRLDREDFVSKGVASGLYDYRGYESLFQYHHPLASYRRLISHYEARRFNHYRPEATGECVGVPFRQEISDSVELGLEGRSRGDYLVRVGWGRFLYERQGENCFPDDESDQASSFRGITGFARWRQPLGPRTALIAIGSRRPLPSNLNTYYTYNTLRLIGERHVSDVLTTALEFGYDVSRYADEEATQEFGCSGTRTDQHWDARASANWNLHKYLNARAEYSHDQRDSNCANTDYTSDSFSLGLALGW